MLAWEIRGVFGLMAARRLSRRRAVRREPTETNTFEVNNNEPRRPGVLTPFRWPVCGRTLNARFGGAKRDNLLVEHRFAIPPTGVRNEGTGAHLNKQTHEKTSVFRGSAEFFGSLRTAGLGDTGLEPVTPTMSR